MFNHGLTASTLFLFVWLIETRSGGLRGLDDFGGIRKVVPVFSGLMGIALFSSLGLPGLNGFVGEFLIFKGVFPLAPWAAALATIGLLVTAIFLLTIIQRVFCGPLNPRWLQMPDLTLGERALVCRAHRADVRARHLAPVRAGRDRRHRCEDGPTTEFLTADEHQ